MKISMSLPTVIFTASVMAACSPVFAFGVSSNLPPSILSALHDMPGADTKEPQVGR